MHVESKTSNNSIQVCYNCLLINLPRLSSILNVHFSCLRRVRYLLPIFGIKNGDVCGKFQKYIPGCIFEVLKHPNYLNKDD